MDKIKVLGGNTRWKRKLLDTPRIRPEDAERAARWRAEDRRASNALIAYATHRTDRLPTWLVQHMATAADVDPGGDRLPVVVIYDRLRNRSLVCLWLHDWRTLVGRELAP